MRSAGPLFHSCTFAIVALAMGACGGRTVLDDYRPAHSDEGTDGSSVGADGGSVTTGEDASSGVGFDGSLPVDAGVTVDAVAVLDASPPAVIACGSGSCDPATQECCLQLMGGGGGGGPGGGATCVSKGQCNGAALSCTGSDNCPTPEVCCLGTGGRGGGGAPMASCEMTCGGGGGGGGRGGSVQLCNSDQDCPSGERCVMTPLGINICRGGRGGGGGGGGGSSGGG